MKRYRGKKELGIFGIRLEEGTHVRKRKRIKLEREAEAMEDLAGHLVTLSCFAEHPDRDTQHHWTPSRG